MRASYLGWSVLAALAACGPGGEGETLRTVHGTALAPGGRLSTSKAGKAVAQLAPVARADVYVFRIDDAGYPVFPPLATTSTGPDGSFSFAASEEWFRSDVIVQVKVDGPAPVAGASVSSPLVGDQLVVDPASQLATDRILGEVGTLRDPDDPSQGTVGITDFTAEEAGALVEVTQTVQGSDGGLIAPSVDETVQRIEDALPPGMDETLDALGDQGSSGAPTGLGGTYRFFQVASAVSPKGSVPGAAPVDFERWGGDGSLVIDPASGVMDFTIDETRIFRTSACGAGVCDRVLGRGLQTHSRAGRGRATPLGSGQVFLSFGTTRGAPETCIGHVTPDGSLLVVPIARGAERGIGIGVRQGVSLSVSTLNGEYGFGQASFALPPDTASSVVGPGTTWPAASVTTTASALPPGFTLPAGTLPPGTSLGLTFGPGAVPPATWQGIGLSFTATQVFSCLPSLPPPFPPSPVPTCNLSSTLQANPVPPYATPVAAVFGGVGHTVSPQGAVTLPLALGAVTGQVTSSGNAVVVQAVDPFNFQTTFGIGVRRDLTGSMNLASLNGEYNFTAFEDLFQENGTTLASVRTGLLGLRNLGAVGQVTMRGDSANLTRSACADLSCGNDTVLPIEETFGQAGAYAVAPNGDLTVSLQTYGGFLLLGSASSDGQIVVMFHVRDQGGIAGASRILAIGTRR